MGGNFRVGAFLELMEQKDLATFGRQFQYSAIQHQDLLPGLDDSLLIGWHCQEILNGLGVQCFFGPMPAFPEQVDRKIERGPIKERSRLKDGTGLFPTQNSQISFLRDIHGLVS